MHAILIHYIGYLLIDQMMPGWVAEAGWVILAAWYGSFVAIDMIAIMVCRRYEVLLALAVSVAWSACIMIEVSMGSDIIQRHDQIAQWVVDALLTYAAVVILFDCYRSRFKVQGVR